MSRSERIILSPASAAALATMPAARSCGSSLLVAALLLSGISALASTAQAGEAAVRERAVAVLRAGLAAEGPDDFWASMHAAEGLTMSGHSAEVRQAIEPLLATTHDPRHRCGLARELVRAGDRAKVAVMAEILAGDDTRGHVHAAESLFKVGEIGDAAALDRAFANRSAGELHLMAAAALARRGGVAPAAAIRAALRGDDPDGIGLAGWILGQIGDASDIEPLRAAIPRVAAPLARAQLEHALAALGDPAGRAALDRNLTSADGAIRTAAANTAGEAQAAAVVAKLVRLLDDPVLDARIRAAHSLLLLDRH
jgi:sialidase-1